MSAPSVSPPKALDPSLARRFIEGTVAVALWIAIGLIFELSANAYLIVGIPITLAFQKYVRRAPLRAMWVCSAPPFYLGLGGRVIAVVLLISPLVDLIRFVSLHQSLASSLWMLVAMAGGLPAAYALRSFGRGTFRELLICLATAGTVGCTLMVAPALINQPNGEHLWSKVTTGLTSFLQYIPAVFLLEEVWFRGVLDSHLHRPGEPRGAFSAVYVSALWGLWHLPLAGPHGPQELMITIVSLLVVHISIGALLSRAWRRSGNLLVPGTVHALIDAVRNAVL